VPCTGVGVGGTATGVGVDVRVGVAVGVRVGVGVGVRVAVGATGVDVRVGVGVGVRVAVGATGVDVRVGVGVLVGGAPTGVGVRVGVGGTTTGVGVFVAAGGCVLVGAGAGVLVGVAGPSVPTTVEPVATAEVPSCSYTFATTSCSPAPSEPLFNTTPLSPNNEYGALFSTRCNEPSTRNSTLRSPAIATSASRVKFAGGAPNSSNSTPVSGVTPSFEGTPMVGDAVA
jgi:hypothetical protein